MKKIIVLITLIVIAYSCKKDDDDGCTCTGEFTLANGSTFFGNNVDCETGNPVAENNPDAFFIGCEN